MVKHTATGPPTVIDMADDVSDSDSVISKMTGIPWDRHLPSTVHAPRAWKRTPSFEVTVPALDIPDVTDPVETAANPGMMEWLVPTLSYFLTSTILRRA